MDKKIVIVLVFIAFLIGMHSKNLPETEMPYGQVSSGLAPTDWIKQDKIRVYPNFVQINLRNAKWANFTNTNSMIPVLSSKSNAIQIVPEKPEDIKIGDIVSFRNEKTKKRIIHRVIGIGSDITGIYFITKGDNNKEQDPFKVRFSDIERVVVAVIY